MNHSTHITPEGWDKLVKEMEALWEERRVVTEAVSEAAAMGDRSENAEYIYGKKKLRELDRRISYLHKRSKILKVYTPLVTDEDLIIFGAYVEFKDESGRLMQFRVVGPDEADIKLKTLSTVSPIGSALLDKRVGDVIKVKTPAGIKTFTILKVSYNTK